GLAVGLAEAAVAGADRGVPGAGAAFYLGAAQLGGRGPEREGRLLSALELLVRTADVSGADALRPQAEHLPASARRDAVLGQLAMLKARPAAAEALFLAAWSAHEDRSEPAAAAAAAAGLAMIYANASERECLRWARRSMQVSPGSVPPAVLGAQALARAMAGEAAVALRMLCFVPGAPALVPDAQADALTVRGLLRLWTGDESGADDDLTAVVTRIKGGLRPRYPGQALGYLAESRSAWAV